MFLQRGDGRRAIGILPGRVLPFCSRNATEQPRLFAHMFLREDGGMQSFGSELAREPMITAEASEKGLDSEKAKRVCEDVMLYAHGLAAMQATGRTNFTQPQIAQRVHEMHEMLLKK